MKWRYQLQATSGERNAETGEKACAELIFPEFVEAILRAGLFKFSADETTPMDLKIHEMCLLLSFGAAGPLQQARKTDGSGAPLSGVERRPPAPAPAPAQ